MDNATVLPATSTLVTATGVPSTVTTQSPDAGTLPSSSVSLYWTTSVLPPAAPVIASNAGGVVSGIEPPPPPPPPPLEIGIGTGSPLLLSVAAVSPCLLTRAVSRCG